MTSAGERKGREMNEIAARPVPRIGRLSAASFAAKGIRLDPLPDDPTTPELPAALGADALVVLLNPADDAAVAALTSRARIPDAPPVIAVVNGLTVNDTRRLLKAGVADVLPGPLSMAELEKAMEVLRSSPRPGGASDGGQVVAFFGTGGSGATSLAVQSAVELARSVHTCLIDFDIQFGNAALQLDMKPALSLLDLAAAGERLDQAVLQSVAAEHPSGLSLVCCPPEIQPLDELVPATVDRVIAVARRQYAMVILDLPPEWTDWKVRAVERSDLGLLVAQPSVLGVHRTKRILPLLEANRIGDRVLLVANRVTRSLFRDADLSQQESVLGRSYAFRVAEDVEGMTMAIEQGRPLADVRSGSRLLKDVRALAEGIEAQVRVDGAAS